jgi:hypothetical protein
MFEVRTGDPWTQAAVAPEPTVVTIVAAVGDRHGRPECDASGLSGHSSNGYTEMADLVRRADCASAPRTRVLPSHSVPLELSR